MKRLEGWWMIGVALVGLVLLVGVYSYAHAGEETKSFHCFTRVVYRHWVRGTRCPIGTSEVVLGSMSQFGVPYVDCGKLEAECFQGERVENSER